MLRYPVSHGVSTVAPENSKISGKLKLLWIRSSDIKRRNYNYGRSVLRSLVIEVKVPL